MKNFEKYKTAKERTAACSDFLVNHKEYDDIPYIEAAMIWLELEAEKEEPLPCPFCGSRCLAIDGSKIAPDRHGVRPYSYVKCEKCGYESIMTDDYDKIGIGDIIAAHNLVAKAVMDAKK